MFRSICKSLLLIRGNARLLNYFSSMGLAKRLRFVRRFVARALCITAHRFVSSSVASSRIRSHLHLDWHRRIDHTRIRAYAHTARTQTARILIGDRLI
jgi:hypothetical protein